MEKTLGLLGTAGGGGGRGVPSGVSTTGSMSTVSKEDNNMGLFSHEVSSSYPDESGLELGLGLSLGGGASFKSKPAPWGQYARILTAKDFPTLVSKSSSSSSSAVTKAANNNNNNISSAGSKRIAAESVSPPNGTTSQVVGWPPIRAYRMNSLVNQAKLSLTEEFNSIVEDQKSKDVVANKANNSCNKHNIAAKVKGPIMTSLFVKVNMDGVPIGRKVDLNAHSCYVTLAQTLEEMFCTPTTTISTGRSSMEEHNAMAEGAGPSKLLDGSSEFVLTYEDKEGDWMLVGDVPWRMFPSSVKRLRIMRTSEANGLAPKSQERSGRQRTRAI